MPHTPHGLGGMDTPMAAPPWWTAWFSARRSMAWATASRALTLSKGGFLVFMMTFSFTFSAARVITICGMAFFSCSAVVLLVSPGKATSTCPACSAATRVPRSLMITYLMPSRYGRPLTK